MKRIMTIFMTLLVLFFTAGCSLSQENPSHQDQKTIVCTGFSQYDWIVNILGDDACNWNIIRLNERGTDMHSYLPSVKDMSHIISADLVVYTGGLSEDWLVELIEENENFQGNTYCLLAQGEAKEEITVEGMFTKGHHHTHVGTGELHHDEPDHHDRYDDYDEHIWLSPRNAITFCRELAQVLGRMNPDNQNLYETNSKNYIDKLMQLDNSFSKAMEQVSSNTVVFADRFPFRYLADDYGITFYAAFPGCSAETEADFDTVIFLADKLNELSTPALLITESSDDSMAKTIIKTSMRDDAAIYILDSLQSVTDKNTTYIGTMEKNLHVLKQILN